jgi:hypothetical protein
MNEVIRRIYRLLFFGVYRNLLFAAAYFARKHGYFMEDAQNLQKLENSCSGRCFIIATGPSLTFDDLHKLKNEATFGMNSLSTVFEEIGWETTYFIIQDYRVYCKYKKWVDQLRTKIFFSLFATKGLIEKKCWGKLAKKENSIKFPLYIKNHMINKYDKIIYFSEDISKIVYDGYTVTYSALQFAMYMGYTEIYLIGADCDYSDPQRTHFNDRGTSDIDKNAGEPMMRAYESAQKYAKAHNIRIANATRGGKLEVFERVNLEDILAQPKPNASKETPQ